MKQYAWMDAPPMTVPTAFMIAECEFCGRPEFLWGGETCDVCDADNDGTLDRYQETEKQRQQRYQNISGDDEEDLSRFDPRSLNTPPHPQVIPQSEWAGYMLRQVEPAIRKLHQSPSPSASPNLHTPENEAKTQEIIRRINGLPTRGDGTGALG